MERQGLGRRDILRTVGVAAGGVALSTASLSSTAHADDDHDDEDGDRRGKLNGSWMVTAVADGDPGEVIVVASFASGGVAITHEIKPAGPPYTGTWGRQGKNGFQSTSWSGFPDSSTVKLHTDGSLLRDGTIEGTFTLSFFDPNGDPAGSVSGTFTGVRIHPSD
ncbi:MAG: hypothetical protein QOJ08_159 [Ilumatobacteraceae bacterium]